MVRVLVIEDDVTIADLVRTIIDDDGHSSVVSTSPAALPPGPFDIIVTDLFDGVYTRDGALAWLKRLGAVYPGVPTVVITAHRDVISDRDALPAHRVIIKPFEIDELLTAIREAPPV